MPSPACALRERRHHAGIMFKAALNALSQIGTTPPGTGDTPKMCSVANSTPKSSDAAMAEAASQKRQPQRLLRPELEAVPAGDNGREGNVRCLGGECAPRLAHLAPTLRIDRERAEDRQNEECAEENHGGFVAIRRDMECGPDRHAPQERMPRNAQHTLDRIRRLAAAPSCRTDVGLGVNNPRTPRKNASDDRDAHMLHPGAQIVEQRIVRRAARQCRRSRAKRSRPAWPRKRPRRALLADRAGDRVADPRVPRNQ